MQTKFWIHSQLIVVLMITAFTFLDSANAQRRRVRTEMPDQFEHTVDWDLGAAVGSYNQISYTEINLGLNWHFMPFLTWRNALFTRMVEQGDGISGWDTSLRAHYEAVTSGGGAGFGLFGGPGYRLANNSGSATFLEGGVLFKLGGLNIGGGAKQFYYNNPGKDALGRDLAKTDTVYFLILAGSGSL